MSLPPKIDLVGGHLLCRNVFLDEAQKLAVLDALRAAVDEEREACAKLAEQSIVVLPGDASVNAALARAIRARR